MKQLFPGSYPLNDDDFRALWGDGMFVFDTNMLLNFYRYSDETRQEFLDIVSSPSLAPRIWIPYQVALEYHRNLDSVRYEQVAACIKMKNHIKDWAKSLRAGDHRKRADQFLELADKLVLEAEEQYRHPSRQALIDRIAALFEGKVGQEWDEKRLQDTYKDGEKRYAQKIPPGFEDASRKKGDDRFGDLVIWYQLIEEVQKRKCPVVMITDDVKEDWWLDVGGRTLGPLPSLRNELFRKAGVLFYMYSGDRFLEQARISLKRPVRDSTVAEVKEVRVEQQKRRELDVNLFSSLAPYFRSATTKDFRPRVTKLSFHPDSRQNGDRHQWRLQFEVTDASTGQKKLFSRSADREELSKVARVLVDESRSDDDAGVDESKGDKGAPEGGDDNNQ